VAATRAREQGYLVIADISGYTSFLARTELEHAHGIVAELTELVIARLGEPLLCRARGRRRFRLRPRRGLRRRRAAARHDGGLLRAHYAALARILEDDRRAWSSAP